MAKRKRMTFLNYDIRLNIAFSVISTELIISNALFTDLTFTNSFHCLLWIPKELSRCMCQELTSLTTLLCIRYSVCCIIPSRTSHAVCTAQVLRPVWAVCYDRSQSSVLMSGSGRVRSCGRSSCSASTFRDNCIAPPTERSRGCVSVCAGPAVACAAAFARCSLRVCRFFIIFNSLGLRRYLDLVTKMKLVLISLCAKVEVN